MSNYVDKFIKQHKEYFGRNKVVIENNKWNSNESFNSKMKEFSNQILSLKEVGHDDVEKELEEIERSIRKLSDSNSKNREALFKQENQLTGSILSRLTAFIGKASGDRHLPKTQKFIDDTVGIINIHLQKCDDYLDYSMDVLSEDIEDTEETINFKNQEISFQDIIFNKKIDIQDKIDSLNINNSADNLSITFFKNHMASLPMAAVLPLTNIDIEQATAKLNLSKKVEDKEFYINRLRRDKNSIPQWNPKKHYWEQDKESIDFWQNEWLKMTKGFEIDGFKIHPWLYWHLNFFKTPIPQEDDSEIITIPDFRDNEWYMAELIKRAETEGNKGVMLYGSRRLGKSTLMASYCYWKAITKPNSTAAITSGNDGDLEELTHKIRTASKYAPYAFKIHIHKQEWSGGIVELGLKTDQSTLLEYSRFSIKNLAGGTSKSTQKTAGGAPSVFLIEEIGKFPWEKAYLAAKPSFETKFRWKCIPIAVGTGGEASLSGDAVRALSNPSTLNFLEMDWDLLEDRMPKSAITWKRRVFANFVPAQMSYKTGLRSIEKGFGDFLGIDSKELNKITIHQADWEHNTQVLLADRKKVEKDSLKLQQETVQYPIDPEECFLSAEQNPFPYLEAKNHKERIIAEGDTGRKVILTRNTNTGKIEWDFAEDRPVAVYPHPGGFIDSPGLLFGKVPEETPPPYLYVAGFDDYKQEESDNSPSVGTMYIKVVDIPGVKDRNKIVYSLSTRPDPHGKMHRQWQLALEVFNAKAFGENEDEDFKKHLNRLRLVDKFLVESMDFSTDMQISYGGKRKHGWTPTVKNKKFLFGLFVEYCRQEFIIEDADGNEFTVLGVELINDVALLDEIITYKEGNNVDRITAMMGALGYEFYLFVNYMFPKMKKKEESQEVQKNKKRVEKNLAQKMYKTMNTSFKYRR